ncbi:hypothetical protein RLIN73S_03010 [Rhodanobacter lindaniclasticus]
MATNQHDAPVTGAQRAAILLLTLGEQDAAEVLKHLSARDVQTIGTAMAALTSVSREHVTKALDRLDEDIGRQTSLGVGTEEYIRKILVNALGETKAGGLIDRILLGRSSKGLESLKWMESRAIAEMINQEHPQIIALVLAHLEPDQAAEVIGYLPPRVRSDAVMRIATLDGVQPHALNELDEIMERQFSGGSKKLKSASVGGLKAAAAILNAMEGSRETELMSAIRGQDEALGEKIERPDVRVRGPGRARRPRHAGAAARSALGHPGHGTEGRRAGHPRKDLRQHVQARRRHDARRPRSEGAGAPLRGRRGTEGGAGHRAQTVRRRPAQPRRRRG